jgi:hypothetical protein
MSLLRTICCSLLLFFAMLHAARAQSLPDSSALYRPDTTLYLYISTREPLTALPELRIGRKLIASEQSYEAAYRIPKKLYGGRGVKVRIRHAGYRPLQLSLDSLFSRITDRDFVQTQIVMRHRLDSALYESGFPLYYRSEPRWLMVEPGIYKDELLALADSLGLQKVQQYNRCGGKWSTAAADVVVLCRAGGAAFERVYIPELELIRNRWPQIAAGPVIQRAGQAAILGRRLEIVFRQSLPEDSIHRVLDTYGLKLFYANSQYHSVMATAPAGTGEGMVDLCARLMARPDVAWAGPELHMRVCPG